MVEVAKILKSWFENRCLDHQTVKAHKSACRETDAADDAGTAPVEPARQPKNESQRRGGWPQQAIDQRLHALGDAPVGKKLRWCGDGRCAQTDGIEGARDASDAAHQNRDLDHFPRRQQMAAGGKAHGHVPMHSNAIIALLTRGQRP